MPTVKPTLPADLITRIQDRILVLRGKRVMVDADLASLYGVPTKRLNEQVKRNRERFPEDFLFQLSVEEKLEVVANCDHLGNLRFSPTLPYAFTEHGALMAASVLNTPRAIEVSVFVVRAFVLLREVVLHHRSHYAELAAKLEALEGKVGSHDEAIKALVDALRTFIDPPQPKKRKIGFSER
ncbi:MAG: ORF6N domain-containing protein [Holophagaceae bacterium]|nr:ORF6N domain-containing protein [Holophagaceae bacterium]